MRLNEHSVPRNPTDDPVDWLAYMKPATAESVGIVLTADENSLDGRSQWVWVRLPNGDLILGLFPQGDTYCATEHDHP